MLTCDIIRYKGSWSSTIQKRFKSSEKMTAQEKLSRWLTESTWPGYQAKVYFHVSSE